ALTTDVEQAGPETYGEAKARTDEGGREVERRRERLDRRPERPCGVVPHGTAEERRVRVTDGHSRGGEHVTRSAEEVPRGLPDALVGRDDHDRTREDRKDHRTNGDAPRASDDLAERDGPPVLGPLGVLRRGALRGDVRRRRARGDRRAIVRGAHAASTPSGAMPAIISPS